MIPFEQAPKFTDFFNQFDQCMQDYGINSYGVGMTTLEEVFIKSKLEHEGNKENSSN